MEQLKMVEQLRGEAGFDHIALVVGDIHRAMDNYCGILGVERPVLKQTGEPEAAKVVFRGAPTPARSWQAFFAVSGLRVELMQPDENPSTWRETLEQRGEGLHHVGIQVQGLDQAVEALAQMGMPTVQRGCYNGGRYAYVDSRETMGMMLELLESL